MESQKIEHLLENYFEGNTSLEQEKYLQDYFKSGQVAPHHQMYQEMFTYFASAKDESTNLTPALEPEKKHLFHFNSTKWMSIAALLVVALGSFYFLNNKSNNINTTQQQEAQLAFEKTKEALHFISTQFNSSSQNLALIQEFEKSTNKIFK